MKKILIVYYSLGGNTKAAAEAVAEGCKQAGIEVIMKDGLKATTDDLIACDGIAVGTPDYFSYMAGGLKDFFDRTFYPTQGQVTGKPYVAFVTHGGGGKALASIESICGTFKFKKVAEPVLVKNMPGKKDIENLRDLGKKLAASLK
jgi:multimeric flavodoxin WrbA